MDYIQDFSDERGTGWCLHCGRSLLDAHVSRDHVPSKALLKEPYPENLSNVPVCKPCNESFSRDEEYFVALLGCVLSGSTDPQRQSDPRVLRSNGSLLGGCIRSVVPVRVLREGIVSAFY
jgi:hypothetical protein